MSKIAFIVSSEEFDDFIVVETFEKIYDALQCMYGGMNIKDFPEGELVTIGIKQFSDEEFKEIMSREWQP